MHSFRFSQRKVAVAIAVLAVAYTVEAFRIPDFAAVEVPVESGTLPRGLGVVLLVLAVALFFQRPAAAQDEGAQDEGGEAPAAPDTAPVTSARTLGRLADVRLELAVLVGSVCLYVAAFVPLGFLLATALYVFAVAWYLGFNRPWANAVTSVGVATSLYFVTSEVLDVALPAGPLPF